MKIAYGYFEKRHGTHKKKMFLRTKLKPIYQTKNFFGGAHKFCFTNMKRVLQRVKLRYSLLG
jgi:hypothetical protein